MSSQCFALQALTSMTPLHSMRKNLTLLALGRAAITAKTAGRAGAVLQQPATATRVAACLAARSGRQEHTTQPGATNHTTSRVLQQYLPSPVAPTCQAAGLTLPEPVITKACRPNFHGHAWLHPPAHRQGGKAGPQRESCSARAPPATTS